MGARAISQSGTKNRRAAAVSKGDLKLTDSLSLDEQCSTETKSQRPKFDWTDERLEELRKLWEDRVSTFELAEHFGVTRDTIKNVIRRAGLPRQRMPRLLEQSEKRVYKPPNGLLTSEWCRLGLELEKNENLNLREAANRIEMGREKYEQVRNIVRLFDRHDLNEEDKVTAQKAKQLLDDTGSPRKAYYMIRPILAREWPKAHFDEPKHSLPGSFRNKQMLEAFKHAVTVIESTCEGSFQLKIPCFSEDEAQAMASKLKRSVSHLNKLATKIRRSLLSCQKDAQK